MVNGDLIMNDSHNNNESNIILLMVNGDQVVNDFQNDNESSIIILQSMMEKSQRSLNKLQRPTNM